MPSKSSRLFVALATIAVAGATVLGASAASAATAGARPAARHFSAAGEYEASVPAAHMSSHLVITETPDLRNAGTFEFTDIGDYGDWIMQGRTIAMQIASSESGHAGIVLVGKVTHDGITGWVGIPNYGQITWSATRDDAPTGADARLAKAVAKANAQQPPSNAAGTYAAQFPEGPTFSDTLVLRNDRYSTRDGSFSLTGLGDSGYWVQMGRHVVLGISQGSDAGVVMLGTRTTSGFNSAEKTGHYIQPGSGIYNWYAAKQS